MIEYQVQVRSNVTKWYLAGKLHRIDGPAIEYANGTKCWYQNGRRHRTDGPAVEWADGDKEWYLEGKVYTQADHARAVAPCAGKTVEVDGVKYLLTAVYNKL